MPAKRKQSIIKPATAPMEAKLIDELPRGPGWQYEPKWDGFRCLGWRDGDKVVLQAKSGKPLTRFFPEVAEALRQVEAEPFMIDGELLIVDDGAPSFGALQMRLHPAESRIRKLARETPAIFVLFDILRAPDGKTFLDQPLRVRRKALEQFFRKLRSPSFKLSPCTTNRSAAAKWLSGGRGALDGVIAKRLDGGYVPGEREMFKVKCLRSADCVVGGFRYETNSNEVGSLLLGLYDDDGLLHHVGFTSTISRKERGELTRRLEKLIAAPGFTGNAPGGPSRWSTERSAEWKPLKPKLVVEVRYDHVTDGRFRHGTKLLRWRPDKAPRQCTCAQIASAARAPVIVRRTLA